MKISFKVSWFYAKLAAQGKNLKCPSLLRSTQSSLLKENSRKNLQLKKKNIFFSISRERQWEEISRNHQPIQTLFLDCHCASINRVGSFHFSKEEEEVQTQSASHSQFWALLEATKQKKTRLKKNPFKMASTIQLIGPPELYPLNHPKDKDPSVKTLTANYKKLQIERRPMGFTENGSATFLSTGNPCLDFFFHIVPDTPPESLISRLELAWKYDPLTTMKLICNLRGVRGTGKSDREGFYAAALWLHANHPKTLACNLRWIADFGYFKDLPEILFRLHEGLEVRRIVKEARQRRKRSKRGRRKWFVNKKGRRCFAEIKIRKAPKPKRIKSRVPREVRILAEKKRANLEKENARRLRHEKTSEKARRALERYSRDPDYRFLHDKISQVFAEFLISDLQFLNCGAIRKISLASKWCPNLDSSFDRSTLLCENIAKRVFPRESNPEYQGLKEAHYAYRVRDRLRKQVLVPLRLALEIPEVYIGSNRWDTLPYNRVPSVAMRNYTKVFKKHDHERFKQYIESVKRGEATIAAGALLPHEIIESLEHKDRREVAELQWRRMVADLTEKGKLRDCLAICDVSGSMSGTPMEVCVALGLLVSEMNEDPWKGKVITFSAHPQLHKIEGKDLYSKTTFIRQMDCGMNTNFQKVFDLILQVAINGKLREDQMIKRLFVFSDMEFDQASSSCGCVYNYQTNNYEIYNNWETDYEAIKRKYQESGYGNSVPQIVFWNLRDSKATPVMGEQKGVALVSGFSKNLLTLFLDGMDSEKITPEYVMEKAISGEEYKQLVVVD